MHPRVSIAALALIATLTVGTACDPEPGPLCAEAYDHLIGIAKRPDRPEPRDRFVSACIDAFDEGRHRCIMGATTAEDALACRPRKVRPG